MNQYFIEYASNKKILTGVLKKAKNPFNAVTNILKNSEKDELFANFRIFKGNKHYNDKPILILAFKELFFAAKKKHPYYVFDIIKGK